MHTFMQKTINGKHTQASKIQLHNKSRWFPNESQMNCMALGNNKLTKAGELLSSSLTSTTFPETGELTSLVALTLSTAPKLASCFTVTPTSGNSTYTTSPKWSWAWSVIPMVAELPSTLTHSWESAYFRSFITAERLEKHKLKQKK